MNNKNNIVKQYTNKDVYLATLAINDNKRLGAIITFKEIEEKIVYTINIEGENEQKFKDLIKMLWQVIMQIVINIFFDSLFFKEIF